ncbi:uncharacterized protein LOC123665269 [Melitaea cinxia]|uniref:uncharacterized protein LOC123665269 n=1 Tax=Melitaea cinxia TaxID=113334 RepID=UPI001E270D34|nr:uncharacterized protein LOC123665269 [Melitaea cinxia]
MTTAVNNPNKLKGGVSARSSDGNQLTCAQRAIRKCRHRKKTLCSNLVQKTLVTEDPYYYEINKTRNAPVFAEISSSTTRRTLDREFKIDANAARRSSATLENAHPRLYSRLYWTT